MTPEEGLRLLARGTLRSVAREAWESALARVNPEVAVAESLSLEGNRLSAGPVELADVRQIVVLGFGKAGVAMLRGAMAALPGRIRGGLVVVKDGHADGQTRIGPVRIAEAGHPVPDERSVRLAGDMLDLARSVAPDELALVLGSGGGSSLIASPVEGIELADLVEVTNALLRSGADIREMNAVRRHLSAAHGGRLAAAFRCRSLSLLVSDVVGDDLPSIASGPTVPDPTTWAEAADILKQRLGRRIPARVSRLLKAHDPAETPKAATLDWGRHPVVVVASAVSAVDAALDAFRKRGFKVEGLGAGVTGDVADVAASLVSRALAAPRSTRPQAIVAGGETTVTVSGPGVGGRNQHLAALAARRLDAERAEGALEDREIVVVSLATEN